MNVAIVNRLYYAKGAIPLIQRSLAKWLTRKNIDVTVFASDVSSGDSDGKTVFVKTFTRKVKSFDITGFIFACSLFFRLIGAHRKRKIDILQVHDTTGFYGAWLFGRIFRVPATVFLHGWIYNPVREKAYPRTVSFIYKMNARFCSKHADLIWAVSQEITDGMVSIGTRPDKVKLWLNSVDFDELSPSDSDRISNEEKTVLFAGRFREEKGLIYLLRAIPGIVEKCPL